MSSTPHPLLLRTAVLLALALPQVSSFQYALDAPDLDHIASPSSSSSSSSSGSVPYAGYGSRLAPGSAQVALRKRISQISCQCCSNSFNSHCCLKCMQRVGKRSGVKVNPEKSKRLPSPFSPVSDLDPVEDKDLFNLFPDEDQSSYASLVPSSSDGEEDGVIPIQVGAPWDRPCMCCLDQMRESPLASNWPCCSRCLDGRMTV